MPGVFEGILNQIKNKPKPKSEFDISRTDDLGFSSGYGQSLEDALDQIYQRQLSEATQQQAEQSGASGDFNPNLSNYYATKGARESQSTGKVKAIESARGDEYNRFNVMNAINNYGLQKGYLDLQKEMYDDSKPGWLDDVFGGINTLSNIVPFFKKGGEVYRHSDKLGAGAEKRRKLLHGKEKVPVVMHEFKKGTLHSGSGDIVKNREQAIAIALSEAGLSKKKANGGSVEDSDYFLEEFGGDIPMSEINSNMEYNGDNTLIKAQPGEVIQSNPAGDLMGRENLKTINEAGKMADNLFANAGTKMAGAIKPMGAGMMPASPISNVPQNQTLGQRFGEMIKGMFRSNPQGATKMEAGGDVPSPYDAEIAQLEQRLQAIMASMATASEDEKDDLQSQADSVRNEITILQQKKQEWRKQQNPSNELKADGGAVLQPGQQEQPKIRKISIEEKPLM